MRRCINPECFQGNPGDPPEYVSDRAEECVLCGEEIDLDEDEYWEIDAGNVCESCAEDELRYCLQCEYRFYPPESKAQKREEFCSKDCEDEFNKEEDDE